MEFPFSGKWENILGGAPLYVTGGGGGLRAVLALAGRAGHATQLFWCTMTSRTIDVCTLPSRSTRDLAEDGTDVRLH